METINKYMTLWNDLSVNKSGKQAIHSMKIISEEAYIKSLIFTNRQKDQCFAYDEQPYTICFDMHKLCDIRVCWPTSNEK